MRTYLVIIGILLLGFTSSFGQSPATTSLPAAAFKEKMEQTPRKTVLDVRTEGEVAAGIIPGALTIDFFRPDFSERLNQLDKTKPVFVYCAVGGRSAKAAQQLETAGFKAVYNLAGGMQAWQKAGYALQSVKK